MIGRDLRFRDLGPILVESGGVVEPVGGARLEQALALLLICANRLVTVDALREAVWGDQGVERSVSTLDSHIWRLRRRLEPERPAGDAATVVVHEPGGYRLAIGPEQADSTRFVRLADDATALLARGEAAHAVGVAEEALGLWRGRPYGRSADHEWARPAIGRLEEIRGALRETYICALLGTGAAARALVELETVLSEEPLRERLWAYRITAYQRTGRRSAAMQSYSEARSLLLTELGVEPGPELQALYAELLRNGPAPVEAGPTVFSPPVFTPPVFVPPVPAYRLPVPRTRLIGREAEIATVTGQLGPGRLITVVGTAGCGKTRLAVEIARAGGLLDSACFVDLTAASPGRVLDTVTSALGQPSTGNSDDPVDDLRRLLTARSLLLVLDNCEHVLDDVANLVDDLLAAGSRSAVLATSREPLSVAAEKVIPLDPLPTAAAVELFLERLDAAVPGGARVSKSMATVCEIVTAVDRLPLALELAAGRARAYTLTEIAGQVRTDAGSLGRVGRGRGASHHRTVFEAVDTSYRDLPPSLAVVHRAVGAVPGPFTAELAAGLVGVRPAAVVDDIAGLVHRSLLTPLGPARPGGASRFAQFVTVRGHAAQSAERAGEDTAVLRDGWVERLVGTRPSLGSIAQGDWYRALEDDLAALRATLHHTLVAAPSAAGVTIAGRLGLFWAFNGMPVEGMSWLQAADRCLPTAPAAVDRALLHLSLSCEFLMRGNVSAGCDRVRAGIAEGRTCTGPDAVAVAEELAIVTGPLRVSGQADVLGEVAAATRMVAADAPALDVFVRHTELVHELVAAPRSALITPLVALHDEAQRGDNHYTAWSAAAGAARLLLADDEPDTALRLARAALSSSARAGMRHNIFALELYGTALALVGEQLAALRALGAAEAQHRGSGRPWPPNDTVAALLRTITDRVGADAAERARTEGARATVEQFAGV